MSATNRTDNYNLPIFIETDKPAWLVDFNGAMRSIDAQMKLNAEAIATKSPILTFQDTADIDFTKTGDIITANLQSAITDKVGRALVTPLTAPESDQLVAINDSGAQEALDIGTGLVVENNTLNAIDLNLTDTGETFATISPSGLGQISLFYAFNEAHTIGKIYGVLYVSNATANRKYTLTFDNNAWVPAPETEFSIWPIAHYYYNNSNNNIGMTVTTEGRIKIEITPQTSNMSITILPMLYFFKDFGDVPVTP